MRPERTVYTVVFLLLVAAGSIGGEPASPQPEDLQQAGLYLRSCFEASCARRPLAAPPHRRLQELRNAVAVSVILPDGEVSSAGAGQSSMAGNIRLATARAVAGKPAGKHPLLLTVALPGEQVVPPPALPSRLEKKARIGSHIVTGMLQGKRSVQYPSDALLKGWSWKDLLFRMGSDLATHGTPEKEILALVTSRDLRLALQPCLILAMLPDAERPVLLNHILREDQTEETDRAVLEASLRQARSYYAALLSSQNAVPLPAKGQASEGIQSLYSATLLADQLNDSDLKRLCLSLLETWIGKHYIEAPGGPSGYIRLGKHPQAAATAYTLLTSLSLPETKESCSVPLKRMAHYGLRNASANPVLAYAALAWVRKHGTSVELEPLIQDLTKGLGADGLSNRLWLTLAARELYALKPYRETAEKIVASAETFKGHDLSRCDLATLAGQVSVLHAALPFFRKIRGMEHFQQAQQDHRTALTALLALQVPPALEQLTGKKHIAGAWRRHSGTLLADQTSTNLAVLALIQCLSQAGNP